MAAYRRTIYLVNPRFQVKFSFFVSSLVFTCSLVYPLVIYETYDQLMEQAKNTELVHYLGSSRGDILQMLILFQVIFVILVFIICIFQSHKIAGPLHRLRQYLARVREGQVREKITFRKGDNFQELAEELNMTIDAINRNQSEGNIKLGQISRYLTKSMEGSTEEQRGIYHNVLAKISEIK